MRKGNGTGHRHSHLSKEGRKRRGWALDDGGDTARRAWWIETGGRGGGSGRESESEAK